MAPKAGTRAYLHVDVQSQVRVLVPGTVTEVGDEVWTLAIEHRHEAIEVGETRRSYFHRAREFVQQEVRVRAKSSEQPPYVLTLESIGPVESADTPSERRVDVSDCGIEVTLGDEPGCPMLDVSLSGLAVISTRSHSPGEKLPIVIHYAERDVAGEVEIQSAVALGDGKTRCGLRGDFDAPGGRALKTVLIKMTLEIHNHRLKQMSGSS